MLHDVCESSLKMFRVDGELGNYTIQILKGFGEIRDQAGFIYAMVHN